MNNITYLNQKKGQESIGMSFNMIFSIFIIIVIIAVGIYVLIKFIGPDSPVQCANTGLFYDDIQTSIDKILSGDVNYEGTYEGEIKVSGGMKSGVTHVCFGNLSEGVARGSSDENIYRNLSRRYIYKDYNMFMYPPEKVCDGLEAKKLNRVIIENFFCINAKENNGIIRVRLESFQGSPVKITRE